jgi:hypothetical protein
MISDEKTRWLYIREIFNLECSIGIKDFGRGVKLIPLSSNIAEIIDKSIPRLYGRSYDKKYWVINCEPLSKSDLIDGDPAGGLRILPVVMLIVISPFLKFGPSVFLKIEEGKTKLVGTLYDQLHTLTPLIHPDDFVGLINEETKKLQEIFEKLLQNLFPNILDIPRGRYIRACLDKKEDDGIIDLAIALESLYGGNKENIARRGASFIGASHQDREKNYTDIAALFWARNKILHEGIAYPNITLENGRALDVKEIRNGGFYHCAQALKKMLMDPFWQGKTKREVLNHYKSLARPLKSEFDNYKLKYQSITTQRNP